MPQLNANNLECERHNNILFSDLTFTMKDGDLLQIDGTNGSGKSSLLQICSGLIRPSKGTIKWNNENIYEYHNNFQKDVLYLGHKNAIKSSLTIKENMKFIAALGGIIGDVGYTEILNTVGLSDTEELYAGNLSAGQQRRLSLTRLLMTRSKFWLLDEPFNALDKHGKRIIENIVFNHCNSGGIVIFTTHQEMEFKQYPLKSIHLGNNNV